MFENILIYAVQIFEYFCLSPVFDYTHSVTELLQAKSNDIVKRFDLTGSLIDLFANVRHDVDDYYEK